MLAITSGYHFFLSDVPKINSKLYIQAKIKQSLAEDFLTSQSNESGVSSERLKKIYEEWDDENGIANKISAELDKVMGKFNLHRITGANLKEDVLNRVSSGYYGKPGPKSESMALLDEVHKRMVSWFYLLEKSNSIIEMEILKNYVDKGISIPKEFDLNGKKIKIDRDVDVKFRETAEKLVELINEIKSVDNKNGWNTGREFDSLKKGQIPTVNNYANAVGGCLASIGGEVVYEPLVSCIAMKILKEEGKINEKLDALFESSGGLVISGDKFLKSIGKETLNDQQITPDIAVLWNENGVTLKIQGSVKLRQGKSDFNKSGEYIGAIDYKTTLGELLNLANSVESNSYEGFIGALTAVLLKRGAKNGGGYVDENRDLTEYKAAWEVMKDNMVYKAFYKKFVGSGEKTDSKKFIDTAHLFIVNNKIMSFHKILSSIALYKMGDNSPLVFSGPGYFWQYGYKTFVWDKKEKKYNSGSTFYYHQNQRYKSKIRKFNRKKEKTKSKNGEKNRVISGNELRKHQAQQMINNISSKKIYMNLYINKIK